VEPQVRYCTTSDGVSIAYCMMGEGSPVVFLPAIYFGISLISKVPSFTDFFSELARTHQIIVYDSRGFGLSQRDAGGHSLDDRVRDLDAVVQAANLEEVSLFASSFTGPTAITFAVRHPAIVTHLLLFGTFARAADVMPWDQAKAVIDLCRTNWDVAAQLLADMSTREEPAASGIAFAREHRANARGADYADQLALTYAEDVTGLLPSVRTKTLVLHRRDDAIVPFSVGQKLAAGIPGARLVPLEGRTHAYTLGDTGPILDAIEKFLSDDERLVRRDPPAASGRVTTVLFTDIVGHTEMMQRLGDVGGRDLLREHERITRETLKQHGGTEVKTMGDGFMASFGSVIKAMDCAIALQRAFAAHTESMPEPLHVRVGLSAGEPIEEDGDLFGSTVILASRIASKAGAGEILVPDTVRGLLSGKGFVFGDRGEFVPKGFDESVRLWDVRWRE
jgi:class 3 adenylate cyclase